MIIDNDIIIRYDGDTASPWQVLDVAYRYLADEEVRRLVDNPETKDRYFPVKVFDTWVGKLEVSMHRRKRGITVKVRRRG